MDGSGSPVPDGMPFSPGMPSSRSGSVVAPPSSVAFSGMTHQLGGAARLPQASDDAGANLSNDFSLTLAAPGSGPGVIIRSASRSDSGAASL